MSLYRTTLLTLPSTHHCVESINTLHALFKGVHKRNAIVELYVSVVFSNDENTGEPKADQHLVTLHVDPYEGNRGEVQWFREAAETLVQPA